MARGTLNLGILAHVDAGKTTLTERLLYAAGVIDEVGSVDDGTTQTDSLALERQRGITIRSAVVSFTVGDVTVNLIDTPGHPDFIAEVERALSVLDGAVLVISAVEGVQPQTRILMRALQRLGVPAVLFVNKIDRGGADDGRVLRDISQRLTPAVVAMGAAHELGTRAARVTGWDGADAAFTARLTEVLAEHDEAIMAAYVRGEPPVSYRRLRRLARGQPGEAGGRRPQPVVVHRPSVPVPGRGLAEYQGRDAVTRFCASLLRARRFDLVPTRANGQPAFGTYLAAPAGIRHGTGLYVLTLSGERICAMTRFEGTVLPWFGLPRSLPSRSS